MEKFQIKDAFECGACAKGYNRIKKPDGSIVTEICDCLVERESIKESNRLFKLSGLPRIDLSGWEESAQFPFDTLLNFIEKEDWVFIFGDTGTGKTYMAIIMGIIALLQEKSVYFTGVAKLLDNLRPSDLDSKLRDIVKNNCMKADLLILDDIGQQKPSDWVKEQLYLIIDERYNQKKPIIFTSNFDMENLKETTNKAIYSRVYGMSFPILLNSEEDLRVKNKSNLI